MQSLLDDPSQSQAQVRARMISPKTMFTPLFADSSLTFEEQVQRAIKEAQDTLYLLKRPEGVTWKENVLNYVLRLEPSQRLTPLSLSVLTLPKYGGIQRSSVETVLKLVHIYYSNDKCLPKYFERHIELMNIPDINVVTWYFNCLSTLEHISLIPLDAETTRRVDWAMRFRRYPTLPGQKLDPSVYNVMISLCCKKIKTLMGSKRYGHFAITYNMDRRLYTCTKSRGNKKRKVLAAGGVSLEDKLDQDENNDSDEEESGEDQDQEEKEKEAKGTNQDQRKDFQYIPCDGHQPVLPINLRGFALLYNGLRYQHCPRCGSFHRFHWKNYSGSEDGFYRCQECAAQEESNELVLKCYICKTSVSTANSQLHQVRVQRFLTDPQDKDFDPLKGHTYTELVYACERHYKETHRKARSVDKVQLVKHTNRKQKQQNLRIAQGYYRK